MFQRIRVGNTYLVADIPLSPRLSQYVVANPRATFKPHNDIVEAERGDELGDSMSYQRKYLSLCRFFLSLPV